MAEDDVPLLRADATDDQEELDPEIRVPARALKNAEPGTGNPEDMQTFEQDEVPAEPATVEPELRVQARTVPVVVSGVLHGVREEE